MDHIPSNRAFYFTVVFWGKEYADYLINILIASLLSPDNIPALSNKSNSKFVIATTESDWASLQNKPLFKKLKSEIEVIFLNLDLDASTSKMLLMSRGHKLISELLFREKVIGVYVTPDLVLSNGSIKTLETQISLGKKVVLCAAIRFEFDGCMKAFKELGFIKNNQPFNISSRELMSIGLKNLHSESKTWLWDEPYYAYNPVCSLWQLDSGPNYVFHGYSWAPLAVDYTAITQHDTSTFDVSTLDQDYIYKNFGVSKDIYVVTDSDEIALVSFTKESDLTIPLIPQDCQQIPFLKNAIKQDNLRQFHYNPIHNMDPLKQKLVECSVFLHGDAINDSWNATIKRAKNLVKTTIRYPAKNKTHLSTILNNASAIKIANFSRLVEMLAKTKFILKKSTFIILRLLKIIIFPWVLLKPLIKFYHFLTKSRAYILKQQTFELNYSSTPSLIKHLKILLFKEGVGLKTIILIIYYMLMKYRKQKNQCENAHS